jgi:hypothetical protein
VRVLSQVLITFLALAFIGRTASGQETNRNAPNRTVLVELYTSQGCDMCPAAEKILGTLAEQDRRIVPIAFHVDYFNEPWKDVFSDPLYSQRQMTYKRTGMVHQAADLPWRSTSAAVTPPTATVQTAPGAR